MGQKCLGALRVSWVPCVSTPLLGRLKGLSQSAEEGPIWHRCGGYGVQLALQARWG